MDGSNDSAGPGVSVSHVQDEQVSASEESLLRAVKAASEKGIPIRLRLAAQLWDGRQYQAWKGQIWKVDAPKVEDVRLIQESLELFFDALSIKGPERLKQEMQEVLLRLKGLGGVHEETRDGGSK